MMWSRTILVLMVMATVGCGSLQLQAALNRARDASYVLEHYAHQMDTFCSDVFGQVDEYHADPDAAAAHKEALEARCAHVAEAYLALEAAILRLKSAVSAAKADPSEATEAEVKSATRALDQAERDFISAVQDLTHSGTP